MNITNVQDVTTAISAYNRYTKEYALVTVVLIVLLILQWKMLSIPYAFASISGIAAKSEIRKYKSYGNRLEKQRNKKRENGEKSGGRLKEELESLKTEELESEGPKTLKLETETTAASPTRTKYKNFIIVKEIVSAAELPKELKDAVL